MAKKAAFLLAVLAAIASSLPNLYGQTKTPPGSLYLWSGAPWDTNTYLLLMRLGHDGHWLYSNLLTTEPHPPVLSLPFYIVLGHVARFCAQAWARLSGETVPPWRAIPLTFHHSRTVLAFLLALAVYGMTTQLGMRRCRRLWIVAYSFFAMGTIWLGPDMTDFTEGSVLASCITYPHFAASLIFLVGVGGAMLMGLRMDESPPDVRFPGRLAWAVALALAGGAGLGWVHAFDLPPLFGVAAIVLVVRWLQTGRLPRRFLLVSVVFCAASGLSVLHQMWIMWRWPVFRRMDANNVLYWWSRWASLKVMDGHLLLCLPGLVLLATRRRRRPESLFLLAWVIAVIAAMHAPTKYQRRMIEGLPIALSCVLPWTVEGFLVRPILRRGRRPANVRSRIRLVRHAAYAAVLLVLLPRTLAMLRERSVGRFAVPQALHYVDTREIEAADYLARHAEPGSIVWASRLSGNRLPFLSGMRVFYGHHIMTVDRERKEFLTDALFAFALPVSRFREIVNSVGIDYVFWTLADAAQAFRGADMARYDPQTLGEPVFDNGFAKVFAVRRGDAVERRFRP